MSGARRCKARSSRTKKRCARAPILGGAVCATHGGSAPQVRRSAEARLAALVDPAIAVLERLMKQKRSPFAALGAARDVLDRVKGKPTQALEVSGSLDGLRDRMATMGEERVARLTALLQREVLTTAEAEELRALRVEAGLEEAA